MPLPRIYLHVFSINRGVCLLELVLAPTSQTAVGANTAGKMDTRGHLQKGADRWAGLTVLVASPTLQFAEFGSIQYRTCVLESCRDLHKRWPFLCCFLRRLHIFLALYFCCYVIISFEFKVIVIATIVVIPHEERLKISIVDESLAEVCLAICCFSPALCTPVCEQSTCMCLPNCQLQERAVGVIQLAVVVLNL
jgi:hypothetical protein